MVKVAHIGSQYISIYSDFSETTWPVKLKFHIKIPYDRLANIDRYCSGHMTKSGTMPI